MNTVTSSSPSDDDDGDERSLADSAAPKAMADLENRSAEQDPQKGIQTSHDDTITGNDEQVQEALTSDPNAPNADSDRQKTRKQSSSLEDEIIRKTTKELVKTHGTSVGEFQAEDEQKIAQQEATETSAPTTGIYQEKLALAHRGGFGSAVRRDGRMDSVPTTRAPRVVEESSLHTVIPPDVSGGGVRHQQHHDVSTVERSGLAQTHAEHVHQHDPPNDDEATSTIIVDPVERLVEATPVVSGRRKHRDGNEAIRVVPNVPVVEARVDNSRRAWALAFLVTAAVTAAVILGVMIPRRQNMDKDEKDLTTLSPTMSPTRSSQPSAAPSLAPSLSIMPSLYPTTPPSLSPSFGPRPPIPSGADLRSAIQSCTFLFLSCTYLAFPLTCFSLSLDLQEGGVNSSAALEFGYPIGSWNVSQVVDFSLAFSGAASFNEDLSLWITSRAQNFSFMFEGAQTFNQPIGEWFVSGVTTMESMFSRATSFNQAIGEWDTSSVTNMAGIFQGASSFNNPIGQWNTARVVSMTVSTIPWAAFLI